MVTPQVIKPFSARVLKDLKLHTAEIRRCFDWPGIPYHDKDVPDAQRMNRWFWHDLPLLKKLHNSPQFRALADKLFGEALKPSYVFLSMYGKDGVVPLHTDRPQCYRTIDLQIDSDGLWPIHVDDKPYLLQNGEALCYSGTEQPHFRNPMKDAPSVSFMNLAFFHFVSVDYQGPLS